MASKLQCRDCGSMFTEKPNKPGYRDQCPECSLKQPEPEPIGGNMVWTHKTAPELELKPMHKAKEFAKKQERFGAGVTKCLTERREPKSKPNGG